MTNPSSRGGAAAANSDDATGTGAGGAEGDAQVLGKLDLGDADQPKKLSRSERRTEELIIEFQSDSVEIERGPPPRIALLTTWMLLVLFAVGIAYASFAHVDRDVSVSGELVTTAQQVVIQPYETAVIRSIRVQVGDVVHKGEVLATLDSTFVTADMSQLENQRDSYKAQVDRLRAESENRPYVVGAGATPDELQQRAVYERRQAALKAKVTAADEQIAQSQASIHTLQRDIEVLQQRFSVISQVETMRKELEKTSVGSKLNVLMAENDRLSITRDLDRSRNNEVEEQHKLASAQANRDSILDDWRQSTATELVDVTRRYDSVLDELRKVERRKELVNLTAPEDAVVLSIANRSVGSIAQSSEAMMVLVPLDSPLEAEIRIDPGDIGLVKVGLPVQIKLEAFPFEKHGGLKGELRTISENTITPDKNTPAARPYYRGRVKLTDTHLRDVPANYRLLPGMTLSADIKLGERSVMGYLLYPLASVLDNSMHEP